MVDISAIYSILKPFTAPYQFALPYQDLPTDIINGYVTLYPLSFRNLTTAEEITTELAGGRVATDITSGAELRMQVSAYRQVQYNGVSSHDVAQKIRSYLLSSDALEKFDSVNIDLAPMWSDLQVDTYLDESRKIWVEHCHFEMVLYIEDSLKLEDFQLKKIIVEDTRI